MKAIILAAGQGTRLKKYTQDLPKGMLVFDGKTLIERQIELYRKLDISDIVVVRGYAADKIKYTGVRYYNNENYAVTNMVASLLTAKDEFNSDIIVSYSDIIFGEGMLTGMIEAGGDFVVAVDDNWREYWLKRYGRVDFDTESLVIGENGKIISIGLENPPLEEIDARYIGLLKFSEYGLNEMLNIWNRDLTEYDNRPWQQSGKHIKQAYMTDMLNALIQSGYEVKAEHFHGGWLEFDTNDDYECACTWLEDESYINKNLF